jgi:AraC-like DNA-binding protein
VCADPQSLIRKSHLPGNLLDDPSAFIPTPSWYRLLQLIKDETGIPDVGWRAAWESPLKAYSREMLDGICTAPSLLDAMRFVGRTQRHHCNGQSVWVRVLGDFAYVFHYDVNRQPGYEQRAALRAAGLIQAAKAFLGEDWQPDLMVIDTPMNTLPAGKILDRTKILRRQGYNAIRIPRADLASTCCRQLVAEYQRTQSAEPYLPGQIRQLLRSYAHELRPDIAEIAELMHVSARSLQRQLTQLHTSYSRLLQEVRYEEASSMLENDNLSVTEIAHRLGYSDAAHFSRFFRRTSGLTPAEYRKHHTSGLNRTVAQAVQPTNVEGGAHRLREPAAA